MDKNIILHYLRYPYSTSESNMLKIQLQAADDLERLYALEKRVKKLIVKMEKTRRT